MLQDWLDRLKSALASPAGDTALPEGETEAAPRYRWLLWSFIAIAVVLSASVAVQELTGAGKSKDYPLWWRTGVAFYSHQPLYGPAFDWASQQRGGMEFLYSPFAAMVFAPFAALGKVPLYISLILAITAGWYFTLTLTLRALRISRPSPVLIIVPSLLLLEPIIGCFDLGQPNLTLLALCLAALWLDYKGKGWLGGSLLGAAVAFKLFPILIAPYLAVRRRWTALALGAISFLVCFFALPAVVRGPAQMKADLAAWWPAISRTDPDVLAQRPWNWGYKNQSLMALVHRLTRPADTWISRDHPVHINLVDLGFSGANIVYMVVGLALAAWFLWLLLRTPWADQDREVRLWGILLCLVTIATPLARTYYYVWLLMPLTVLVSGLYGQRRFGGDKARAAFVLAVICIALGFGGLPPIVQAFAPMLFAAAAIMWGLAEQAQGQGRIETRKDTELRGLND